MSAYLAAFLATCVVFVALLAVIALLVITPQVCQAADACCTLPGWSWSSGPTCKTCRLDHPQPRSFMCGPQAVVCSHCRLMQQVPTLTSTLAGVSSSWLCLG